MVSRRHFISLPAAASLAAGQQDQPRPHLVLFISDDHGYLDSPVYGSKAVRAPNMQKLAAEGMIMTNAFCGSPTCVPSRAVLMSGLHSARNGAEANHSQMKSSVKTLPTYLKALGYHTAHFGKNHFQPRTSYPDMEFVKSEIQGGTLNNDLDTKAVDAWLAARQSKEPLCLIVGCHSPHVYWPADEGYDPKQVELPPSFVDTPETRAERVKYYTDITNTDRQLGEVLESARKHLGENALFIYTSDNGAQWPFAKWNLYDAGIRMPFIASWPGKIKPGSRCDAMLSFTDIVPTFVEAAGGKPPGELDGRSFLPVMTGAAQRHRSEIFATHSGDGNMNVYPMRCIRTDRYKYILNLNPEFEYGTHIDRAGPRDGKIYWDSWVEKSKTDVKAAETIKRYQARPREELYDVARDPHEMQNLAADRRFIRVLEDFRARVEKWMTEQNDQRGVFGQPRTREGVG
jgi:arylsulfatase A-like enzyme